MAEPDDLYCVAVADQAGPYTEKTAEGFVAACMQAMEFAVEFPDKIVSASNTDRFDRDWDGLSDDEREIVEIVVAGARAVSKRGKGGAL